MKQIRFVISLNLDETKDLTDGEKNSLRIMIANAANTDPRIGAYLNAKDLLGKRCYFSPTEGK